MGRHPQNGENRVGSEVAVDNPTRREQSKAMTDKEQKRQQLSSVTKWLTEDAIGCDADVDEMEVYAQNFLMLGLHSMQMIQEMCTPADILKLPWMKEFHKRRFLSWVHKEMHDKEPWSRQLSSIKEWLEKVAIGYDADALEMGLYAQKFVDLGFHSVKMIQEFCSSSDVDSFGWMKVIHKRVFLSRAQLKKVSSANRV
jgi:hypothetical protein